MAEEGVETAYVTGAASGIGRAVAEMLVGKGIKVFLADQNTSGVETVARELNDKTDSHVAYTTTLDASDWNSQAKAFGQAVTRFHRIDHVYPIAGVGERRWLPQTDPQLTQTGYEKPDLTVLDVDLTGFLYTVSIAVQQFRRQEPNVKGYRGKIGCVASVCGFYCAPTLPIYTAAKHGVVGFIRSYGNYLPTEKILINAVAPNVIRTNISTGAFYDTVEAEGLLTPISAVIDTFESMIDGDEKDSSGEIFELGPNYGKKKEGGQSAAVKRQPTEFLDAESKRVIDMLEQRGLALQLPH